MIYLLALGSAVLYGAADFIGGLASRRAGELAVVAISQLAGLVMLLVLIPFLPGMPSALDIGWGMAAGLAGGTGVVLLYKGLAIGTMGVVAPTTAVCAVAIPAIADALLGQRLSAITTAGIVLALVAIVLVSREANASDGAIASHARRPGLPPGFAIALVSGVAIGLFFLALAQTSPAAGMWPLVGARAVSATLFMVAALLRGHSLRLPSPMGVMTVSGGILDMLANVLYLAATRYGALTLVVTLSSLYPASTVLLARLVLHERLSRVQQIGILCAIVAVVLIVGGG